MSVKNSQSFQQSILSSKKSQAYNLSTHKTNESFESDKKDDTQEEYAIVVAQDSIAHDQKEDHKKKSK